MNRALPISTSTPPVHSPELIAELQTLGVRWIDAEGPGLSRAGGAGPSDHKAIRVAAQTVMVPIFTLEARRSPYSVKVEAGGASATLFRDDAPIGAITFPKTPKFYARSTADGVPYWKIARLHADDVLATTVLQTCVRYGRRETSCQFCAIGQSLAHKATIAEKTPAQLAEVAAAAVELDGVKHVVLTTGTPHTEDRGAKILSDVARAVKGAVEIPIQGQCEPPDDLSWLDRMADAGIDGVGMHLEAVSERVRRKIMPGKAELPVAIYLGAFERAVRVFGRGQVSTYILAGLGDSADEILEMCRDLATLGVYPFVVPFVPIAGTPLEHHPAPSAAFMNEVLGKVAVLLDDHDLRSRDMKAGCGRCGACSSMRAREANAHA